MPPRLTIITPTYRRPESLDKALSSVVANFTENNRPLVEVLVREDHSGQDYNPRYRRIEAKYAHDCHFYFNDRNLGMAENVRRLIDDACGQFVLILTDDDRIFEGGLESLFTVLSRAERLGLGCLLLPRHCYRENGEKVTVSSRTIGFGKVQNRPTSALRLCPKGFILTGMIFKTELAKTFDWSRFTENAYFPIALQYHVLREGGGLRSNASIVAHTVNNETHWHRWGADESKQRERLGRDFLTIYDELTQDAMGNVHSRPKRMYLRVLHWLNSLRFLGSRALNRHPDPDHDAYAAWLRIQRDGALRSRTAFLVVTKAAVVLAWFVRLSRLSVDAMADVGRCLSRRSKFDGG